MTPRHRSRRALVAVLWTKQRTMLAVFAVFAVVSLIVFVSFLRSAADVGQAVNRPTSTGAPTYSPGELATGDPWAHPRPGHTLGEPTTTPATTNTTAGTAAPGSPEQTATVFLSDYLLGADATTTDKHAAWVDRTARHGTPALRATLTATRPEQIPQGVTVTSVSSASLLGAANAAVTLSDGRIVVVALTADNGAWKVTGLNATGQ